MADVPMHDTYVIVMMYESSSSESRGYVQWRRISGVDNAREWKAERMHDAAHPDSGVASLSESAVNLISPMPSYCYRA